MNNISTYVVFAAACLCQLTRAQHGRRGFRVNIELCSHISVAWRLHWYFVPHVTTVYWSLLHSSFWHRFLGSCKFYYEWLHISSWLKTFSRWCLLNVSSIRQRLKVTLQYNTLYIFTERLPWWLSLSYWSILGTFDGCKQFTFVPFSSLRVLYNSTVHIFRNNYMFCLACVVSQLWRLQSIYLIVLNPRKMAKCWLLVLVLFNCVCIGEANTTLLLTLKLALVSLWKHAQSNWNFSTMWRMISIHGRLLCW